MFSILNYHVHLDIKIVYFCIYLCGKTQRHTDPVTEDLANNQICTHTHTHTASFRLCVTTTQFVLRLSLCVLLLSFCKFTKSCRPLTSVLLCVYVCAPHAGINIRQVWPGHHLPSTFCQGTERHGHHTAPVRNVHVCFPLFSI